MAISKGILGINARNYLYLRKYNKPKAKKRADDKLRTKKLFLIHDVGTAALLKAFHNRTSARDFNWHLPKEGFVIKPSRGYGGEGIIVFKNWYGLEGETISGQVINVKQLESHLLDIFDGVYSLQYLPDKPFIEERIIPHPFFKKLSPLGLPDIRVIVFNKVPVMAMIRLPTQESKGKANLHLGALGVGIDLSTGITTHAVVHDKPIIFFPGTKYKIRGIKIPFWDDVLMTAIKTQVVSKLGYVSSDMIIDDQDKIKVLEMNARPGLSIQIANLASLRSRLERVENLEVNTPERGIQLAKNLFAEKFSEKVNTEPKILSLIEKIQIKGENGQMEVEAKVDSGAFRTSLDRKLVEELGLKTLSKKVFVKAASGQQYRHAVRIDYTIAGKKIQTIASVAQRSHLKYPVIIGRKDMKGFLINPITHDKETDFEEDDLRFF